MSTLVLATIGVLVAASHVSGAVVQEGEPQTGKIADVAYALSVAPDGQQMSVWGTEGNLAVFDVATGEIRDLTTKAGWPEQVIDAVFSPNGEQIAYAWHNEQDFDELRLINTDGSELRELYRDPTVRSIWVKDWSPDGRQILVVLLRYDSTSQIAVVPTSGGPPRVIAPLNARAAERPGTMVFSPDGRYIAYDAGVGATDPSYDIFVTLADGSAPVALVRHAGDDRLIGWSPDGKAIVFASDRRGTVDIWLLPLSDNAVPGTPRLIHRAVGEMAPLGLTYDGSYYFAVSTCDCHLYVAQVDPMTGALQGTSELIGPAVRRTGADWSPDGRYLAYVTPNGGVLPPGMSRASRALAIRSVDTGEQRRISVEVDIVHQFRPLWSPDGRLILLEGWDPDAYPQEVVYGIAVESGEVTTLLRSESLWDWMFDWVTWSADGAALWYTQTADATTGIAMRDLASGRQRDLFRHAAPPYVYGLTESPDGQQLAFGLWDPRERKSSLAVWSLPRNERRLLHELPFPEGVAPPAWYPDSRHLMYRAAGKLWRISVDGGKPESLGSAALLDYNQAGLSIHPDGRRIAYVAEKGRRSEVWVIRGLLPGH